MVSFSGNRQFRHQRRGRPASEHNAPLVKTHHLALAPLTEIVLFIVAIVTGAVDLRINPFSAVADCVTATNSNRPGSIWMNST